MTVFNPRNLDNLDHSVGLTKQDCVWGHKLVGHAKLLASKRPDFDLTDTSKIPFYYPREGPLTLEAGFALFDPFFFERRYPQELVALDGLGPDDVLIFDSLVDSLGPYLKRDHRGLKFNSLRDRAGLKRVIRVAVIRVARRVFRGSVAVLEADVISVSVECSPVSFKSKCCSRVLENRHEKRRWLAGRRRTRPADIRVCSRRASRKGSRGWQRWA